MQDLLQYWHDTLHEDLTGFADLRTEVDVRPDGLKLTATWIQRGVRRSETFQLDLTGDFRWTPVDGCPTPYRDFLASQSMADLTQLAAAITRLHPAEKWYVPTLARVDSPEAQPNNSDEFLLSRVHSSLSHPTGTTKLLFVKGDAGAGKTTLLRQLATKQAEKFTSGDAKFLFLYVSAQGRALSSLRDALSGELDDARAGFTRDAVPALVRHGLIVPIVDGFDELLGAAGYGDAFGSLERFLATLSGSGVLVVSARSSFYEVEFLGRGGVATGALYDVEPVGLQPWGDRELHSYLSLRRGLDSISERDRRALEELDEQDRQLLQKPFFASRFTDYVDSADAAAERGTLREFLIDAYVRRESGKIVDRQLQPLVPLQAHRAFFAEVADMMWGRESRDLGEDDLRIVAEYIAEEAHLPGDSAKQFVAKITSYAGFQTARNGLDRRFRFEHEVYFNHFLGQCLRQKLVTGEFLGLLDRAVLPDEVVAAAVDRTNAPEWLRLVGGAGQGGVLRHNRRHNLGAITAAAIRVLGKIEDLVIASVDFVNLSMRDVELRSVDFLDCRFSGVRLERARFRSCRFRDGVTLQSAFIASDTVLDIEGLDPGRNVFALHDLDEGAVYAPTDITRVLQAHGAPISQAAPAVVYTPGGQAALEVLHMLVNRYRRTNIVCPDPDADDTMRALVRHDSWGVVYDLLVRHDIVGEETRQTSGSRKTFIRPKVSMVDLIRHETEVQLPNDNIGAFWRDIRAL